MSNYFIIRMTCNSTRLRIIDDYLVNHATAIRVPVNQTIDDEPSAPLEPEAELRDRYRRLIPYMTYYVINNYVRAQQPQPQQPVKSTRYQKPTNQDERFVPSVQYDPKEISGPESDVFLPLRYGDKENYEDYVRTPRPVAVLQSTIPETRYHTTSRPEYTKLVPANPQPIPADDYPNYGQQQEFESVRFVAAPLPKPRLTGIRYLTQPVAPNPPRVGLNHVLKGLQLTNQLPEVLNKDNIDSSIKTLVEILNILNAGKKDNYAPTYSKFKTTIPKPKVITESNYQATQFSPAPHNDLLEIKTPRPYPKPILKIPIPVPHEDLPPNPYIKAPLPITTEDLLAQIKTTRPYLHPQITTPMPDDVVEIKPKPFAPYLKEDPIQYTKTPPIRYEDFVDVKQPMNVYVDTKTAEEDVKEVEKQVTQTPPTQQDNTQKIVQYYVPIVQDIDEVAKPVSKEPAMAPSIEHHTSQNNFHHHDSILEDERLTVPVSTEEPSQIVEISPVLKYGATRGKPHVDYPAYTEIPETEFSCKQQRYKGFFGDPQTGCQVWHYCDLNGGKSSFLCPNGTIFNQVALTCDWWFNVKCESTTQLYVLNERLYKYILPVMPKFPEDFTGPEVDKYLELKFREMEAKMMMDKKKKKDDEDDKDASPINTLQSIEDSKKR